MKKIAFICGGPSVEREISCLTGLKIAKELQEEKIDHLLIYLDDHHRFYLVREYVPTFVKEKKMSEGSFVKGKKKDFFSVKGKKHIFDEIVILGHGKNIEEGSLAAFFFHRGFSCLSESLANGTLLQDKLRSKLALGSLNVPMVKYDYLYKYQVNAQEVQRRIIDRIGFPLIVKPSSLGSSIGISRVDTAERLPNALFEAFLYDDCVLVETCVENKREINVAILGYEKEMTVSVLEEVNRSDQVLTFYDKYDYTLSNKKRVVGPSIDDSVREKIVQTATTIFTSLRLCGLVRFDFIVDGEKVYFNEANLIPGSLAYYLFPDMKIGELVEKYVGYLEKKEHQQSLLFTTFHEGFMNKVDLSKLKK